MYFLSTYFKNHVYEYITYMFLLLTGIMLLPEKGALHIDRITVEDQGLYTCEATNERGSVGSSAHIWVQSKLLL